ncbi:hypothetical protein FRY74_11650 [Vicingus serpentipes]|uniref:Tetratricopeptide repeat protein n=1 Tax=Vicingus serpentipes TaxID=1926625 RepID=A0A5C6RNV2_9FLAO|nr:hypothetical protein [Vicingus serpentipes]TXB63903.1 hypothetical protein FRY74_11650 [Vicingus serpentipes]
MQTNHFISYLTNPESINELTENSVNTLTNQFPFCQIGQTLNTIYLNNNNSLLFEQQLKKAAIYSSDRKRLFEHINTKTSSIEEKPVTDESQEIEDIEISNPIESTVFQIEPEIKVAEEIDPLEKNYISAAVSSSYLLEAENVISEEKVEKEKPIEEPKEIKPAFNEDVAHSFKDWLIHLKGDEISNDEIKTTTTKKKIHLDVIDKFIQEDPQIKPKKSEFYSSINMARLSVVDDSDMVSETLALIYVEQGNYSNAINTYQKLSLKNPEKRSYFANQIKILKQKIK